jgi:hypothetical protein
MATVNLGRIKFVWQGAYSGATAYVADDVVSYNGSSYICILASTGNLPTNTTYWNLMAQTGTDITSIAGLAQGDVLYYNGTSWVRLGAGTSGQFLKTNGASANPAWATVQAGVLAVTSFTNSTRTSISATSTENFELWSGTVNRTSATSNMVMQFVLSMNTGANGPNIGDFCRLHNTRQRNGVHYTGTASGYPFLGHSYFTAANLGSTTGTINWGIGWNLNKSSHEGSATAIATTWNMNSSDDSRAGQTVSQLTIWELGV